MNRTFVFVLLLASQCLWAAEFSGYATLKSDYVRRGITQSDGNPAFQLGADVNFENGLFVGLWGSTVDITNGPSRKRNVEVDYYAGYVIDVSESWHVDYDYEEYSLGGNYEDRIWLEVAYSPDLYNTGLSSTNIDLYAEWPINRVLAIGGGAGYYDTSNLTGRTYRYWQLGVTASLRSVDIDLRVHDIDTWVPILTTPDQAKSRIALTLQIPF
jgi:uncharacterized protein (TIGR02001 family)